MHTNEALTDLREDMAMRYEVAMGNWGQSPITERCRGATRPVAAKIVGHIFRKHADRTS